MNPLFTFAESFPAALQWVAVMLVGAIPYVEAYGAAAIGIVTGIPAPIAIIAAIIGNVAAMTITVWAAGGIRDRAVRKKHERLDSKQPAPTSAKRQRLARMFERFGVPGVSIMGQLLLPSHLTAPTLVGFGASRTSVLIWQAVGITVWAIVFGALAAAGISFALR